MSARDIPPEQNVSATDSDAETRACPYCGQRIKAAALVCRYCQRDLYAPADAPPLVGVHDWEREKPPEKVVYTVRLPVSERQWALTCYILSAFLVLFWINLAMRPAPAKYAPQPARNEVLRYVPRAPASVESLPPASAKSNKSLYDEGVIPHVRSESATLTEPLPPAAPSPSASSEVSGTSSETGVSFADIANPSRASPAETSGFGHSDSAPITSGSTIDATELIRAYDNHLDVAEDTFTHKPITVSGRVLSAGKDSTKTPFLMLRGTQDTRVRCTFTSLQGKSGPPIDPGTTVRISGTCEGRFVDVMISNCRLLQ